MHVRPRERKSQPQGTVLGGLPPQAEVKGPGRLRRPHMGFDFFPIHNQQQCTLLIRAGKPADPGWEGPPDPGGPPRCSPLTPAGSGQS